MKTGRVRFHESSRGRGRKGARRGIKTTVVTPKWWRDLKAGVRELKRNLLYLLAAIGGMWVTWQVMQWISTHVAGGG